MRDGRRARRQLRPDQYYELRYEDLVTNPEPELRALCAFLDETFDAAMLEPQRMARKAVPKRKEHHARTQQAVSADKVARWAEELEPWEIAVTERVGRRWLREHGYDLTGVGGRPPVRPLLACVIDVQRRELGTLRVRVRDRLRAVRYRQPVASQLR